MQTPRHIWITRKELVIDCAGDELALIVGRLGADIQTVNRKYRHEIEGMRNQSDQDRQKTEEGKRVDDARIRQVIEELRLPEQVTAKDLNAINYPNAHHGYRSRYLRLLRFRAGGRPL